jgi:poly(3-hydroxybutyrate) depolymerase
MIVFHGDQDRVVHPSNAGEFLRNLERSRSGPLLLRSFSGTSASGRPFTRKVYATIKGEALLEDWTVHGSGHGWSGGHAGVALPILQVLTHRERWRASFSREGVRQAAFASLCVKVIPSPQTSPKPRCLRREGTV